MNFSQIQQNFENFQFFFQKIFFFHFRNCKVCNISTLVKWSQTPKTRLKSVEKNKKKSRNFERRVNLGWGMSFEFVGGFEFRLGVWGHVGVLGWGMSVEFGLG
jgi:hypothetical protein